MIGPPVNGGVFGPTLDLSTLVDGNLPAVVDLRSVYASMLDGWLGADPDPILGGAFATLPLFRDMKDTGTPAIVVPSDGASTNSVSTQSAPSAVPATPVVVPNTAANNAVGGLVRNVLGKR